MQVVGYSPRTDEPPALVIAEDGAVREEALEPDAELAYSLGDRHCAGTVDDDGVHVRCDAAKAPYCDEHTSRWACAVCTGNCDMPLESCHEEHAIYLAAFAPDTFKVGVTRSWRLDRRLREQGADRAAYLRTVVNGRVAREIEAEIAAELGDRVRVPTKVRGFHRSVDEAAWADVLDGRELEATYDFDYGLDLTDRPMAETLASGRVAGSKGRVVVIENAGTTYAVDLRNLVGHELDESGSERELQSSLGAFE